MPTVLFPHVHLVFDSSVIIKWFRQEEILAPQALTLREVYLAGQAAVSVPALLIYEITNVLRYKSDWSTDRVQQAGQSLLEMGLEVVSPDIPTMREAVAIARTQNITVYDAAFIALAQRLAATFVTADEKLVKQLASFSFVRFLAEIELS